MHDTLHGSQHIRPTLPTLAQLALEADILGTLYPDENGSYNPLVRPRSGTSAQLTCSWVTENNQCPLGSAVAWNIPLSYLDIG